MAEAAQNPVSQQEKIIVTNKHGEKLVGLLHDTGSGDIVILCHGFTATKEYPIMVNLAVALENEGISSFRFDFSGNGESEGIFEHGNYRKEADDLHSVVEHFSGTSRVASVILGHSKGGDVVLLYASKYHDIRTVVNVSGRYDLKKGIAERLGKDFMELIKKEGFVDIKNNTGGVAFRMTEESLMDHLSTDMHEACLQIGKECQVLTVHGAEQVSMADLEHAKDRIVMGNERKSAVKSEELRKLTAFHEGGHALVAVYADGALPIHKVTIVSRGMSLGMVAQLSEKDDEMRRTKKQMLAELDVCMGGRAAEELIFGENEVTSGASSDIQKATSLATKMVTKYGMSSKIGLVYHDYEEGRSTLSAETRSLIENEVKQLLEKAYKNAKHILMSHLEELDAVANALLEHETLSGSQIKELLDHEWNVW